MVKKYASLWNIENDHQITVNTDPDFLKLLQTGLLLALKERNKITENQYYLAAGKLEKQFSDNGKNSTRHYGQP